MTNSNFHLRFIWHTRHMLLDIDGPYRIFSRLLISIFFVLVAIIQVSCKLVIRLSCWTMEFKSDLEAPKNKYAVLSDVSDEYTPIVLDVNYMNNMLMLPKPIHWNINQTNSIVVGNSMNRYIGNDNVIQQISNDRIVLKIYNFFTFVNLGFYHSKQVYFWVQTFLCLLRPKYLLFFFA